MGDAAAAVSIAESLCPDLVLMDLGMSGMSSIEATRRIKQHRPQTKVLILSMYDDEEYVTRAMEAGASGYVLKEAAASELRTAVIRSPGAAAMEVLGCLLAWWTLSDQGGQPRPAARISDH